MSRNRLPIVLVMSAVLITCLSCCSGITIKTWFLDGIYENGLIRKKSDGTLLEKISFIEANGYRCYSPVDDEAWRNRMAACCAKAMQ